MSQLAKENILDMILASFSREGSEVPDRKTIESLTDNFLKAFGHLSESRDWIVSQAMAILVTSIDSAQELVDPNNFDDKWLEQYDRSNWRSWPWYRLYLKERLRRPKAVIDELDRSTDRILELIGDPNRPGLWDRRGMVVGHVQSGKTQHYTSVAAKAIDAGYKLVIILSGIHENLRQQTQERVEECITGKDSRDQFQPFGVRTFASAFKGSESLEQPPPDIFSLTSVEGDFGAVVNKSIDVSWGEVPVILVIKKNVSILKNLLRKIRGSKAPFSALSCPTLIIDDEADHSSVNTAKIDADTNPTRINELIRKALWACNKVAFVGYTATPYANIFMEDFWEEKAENRNLDDTGSDLFPRAFIIGLEAPSNYIGPDIVFGHDGDESLGIPPRAPLPMHCEAEDADSWLRPKHKSSDVVTGDLPASLCEAIKAFVLSIAARTAIGQDTSHCSMLIHVTRFNAVQAQVMAQVRAYLEGVYSDLESSVDREDAWRNLEELWEKLFKKSFQEFSSHPSQRLDPPVLPDWADVADCILASLARIKYAIVNSFSKENLDFAGNKKNGLIVIAVGGDRLSRGLTLEGLTISYFLRGARAYDTLMQMGRWFGYRPGYAHLCRIYAPADVQANFKMITLATEELRREFSRMCFLKKTPSDYGLRVREPRAGLLVTALNKMRRGESVKIHFAESLISSLDISEASIHGNYEAFRELVTTLGKLRGESSLDDKGNRKWKGVSCETVLSFLTDYSALVHVSLSSDEGKSLLLNYIESVNKYGDLEDWTVIVVGSLHGTPAITDLPFRTVSRKRVTHPEGSQVPIHSGRITFQGVAMGADESLDLNEAELETAKLIKSSYPKGSMADAYRGARPSNRGLLLLYPIIPTLPPATDSQTSEPWNKEVVVGVAVSLPGSAYDTGCDYICNPQKLREIFGTFVDDIYRDDEEDNASDHGVEVATSQ